MRFDACVDAGGFGLIYRGYHEGLGETVAIKCLRIASIQRTNEDIREALAGRFRDETKLLYRLSQGNLDIVRCIGSGTLVAPATNEYTPYMVLEWLDGCTLSVELKERRAQKIRPRALEAAVQLLDSAVGGLAYAHANDVVHRDVKPGNLFLTRTREGVRMKVLDFGLAKILSDESIGVRPSVETGVGVHFCSPSYGAPEQFTSKLGKVGPWTDVYSLALVLLEVMTGDKVRPAANLADGLLKAIDPKTGSPSATSLGLQLPAPVEAVLLRAVAQSPHRTTTRRGSVLERAQGSDRNGAEAEPEHGDGHGRLGRRRDAAGALRADGLGAASGCRASPFAGTMLMHNAPVGAPHLAAPSTAGAALPTDAPRRATCGRAEGDARDRSDVTARVVVDRARAVAAAEHGAAGRGRSVDASSLRRRSPRNAASVSDSADAAAAAGGSRRCSRRCRRSRRCSAAAAAGPDAERSATSAAERRAGPIAALPPRRRARAGLSSSSLCVVLAVVGITFYWVRTH